MGAAHPAGPARDVLRTAAWSAASGQPRFMKKRFCRHVSEFAHWDCAKPHGDGSRGDYAVRGGIIDILSPPDDMGACAPFDLFGDVLDGARRFDPRHPAHHRKSWIWWIWPRFRVILDEARRSRGSPGTTASNSGRGHGMIRCMKRLSGRDAKHQGAREHWLTFYYDKLENAV